MVRVRLAPSPTGKLHIGTARTALFNYLFAKKQRGVFLIRIEDTDQERSRKEFENDILEGLQWLRLQWDEGPGREGEYGPYWQCQRLDLYEQHLHRLLDTGNAYYCYCTQEELDQKREVAELMKQPYRYDRRCLNDPPQDRKKSVLRFKSPNRTAPIIWEDGVRGTVSFEPNTLDDFIIARSFKEPLYNFAVVVDDDAMRITHVIRGEDHISNTPKQIVLAQALGLAVPQFTHIPLILNPDRSKMSKRSNEVSLLWYRQQGYLPEALVNFLALLGWNPGTDQEVFTLGELVQVFDFSRVQKSGAVFNLKKLRWFNTKHLAMLSWGEYVARARPFIPPLLNGVNYEKALAIVRSRLVVLSDITDALLFCSKNNSFEYSRELLVWPRLAQKVGGETEAVRITIDRLTSLYKFLPAQREWKELELERAIKGWIAQKGYSIGETLWSLRVALSGQKDSPNPFELLEALGKSISLQRIDYALQQISS